MVNNLLVLQVTVTSDDKGLQFTDCSSEGGGLETDKCTFAHRN